MTTTRPLRVLSALALAVLTACTSTAGDENASAWPALQPSELGQMHNVAVSDQFWIGSLPSPADLDLASRRQIERIVNLCSEHELPGWDLAAECSRLGLEYLAIPADAEGRLGEQELDRVLALLDPATHPCRTLLFCPDGSRAALVFAVHRVVHEGMPLADVLLEARRVGLSQSSEDTLRAHVDRLLSTQD